ncbi:MAG: peptidylprolyl isomerase [Cyanobacteria bacterium P01_G01_bin.49]
MTAILEVGQQTISASELLTRLVDYQMLSSLVREIMIDEAIADIEIASDRTKQVLNQFFDKHKLITSEQKQQWLQKQGLTQTQLNRQITRQCKIEQFKQITWGNKLEAYFLQRKSQLDQVMYSLLRIDEAIVARELYFRIQEGEQDFAEIARYYSQGPEAQTGGLVGPVSLTSPHPTIAKMLARHTPGQLLPLTRIENWFVIVRLEKYLPAQLDEAMEGRLLNELFNQWLQEQLKRQIPKILMTE